MNHLATLSYTFHRSRAVKPYRLFTYIWMITACIMGSVPLSVAQTNDINTARQPLDPDQQALALLSDEVDTNDIRWLQAHGEKFLALWQPDRTGNPFGAILILHGEGQSVDEPDEINAIRNNLSHFGWATLSVNLPAPKDNEVPPRPADKPSAQPTETPSADANTPEAGNKPTEKAQATKSTAPKPMRHPEEISEARLDAAIAFLNEQGQYNIVVVGQGVGAARAMRYIDNISDNKKMAKVKTRGKIQRPIRAVVLLQARNRIPATNDQLTRYFNDASLPILDLHYGDHFLDRTETKARAKAARAARIENYYQIKILRPTETDEGSENRLTRRIRGFLNKHAKGVEIERNR